MIFFKYFLLIVIAFICNAEVTVNGKDISRQGNVQYLRIILTLGIGSFIIFL